MLCKYFKHKFPSHIKLHVTGFVKTDIIAKELKSNCLLDMKLRHHPATAMTEPQIAGSAFTNINS